MTRMNILTGVAAVAVFVALYALSSAISGGEPPHASGGSAAESDESGANPVFSHPASITNQWMPLSEHRRCEFRGTVDGTRVHSVKTLLDRTEAFEVNGQAVEAAVVEDRAFEDAKLHEVALDYYAQADDGTVYYLGEDVNYYRHGEVVGHKGSFRYGEDTDVLGVAMPATLALGDRFSFEQIPGQGEERNRIESFDASITTPAAHFKPALEIHGLVLPEHEREIKWYARGTGLLAEQGPGGRVELTGCVG